MNEITAVITGVALAFAAGGWAGIEWEQGRQAERDAETREAEDAARTLTFGREAVRLDADAAARARAEELEDAAYAQPEALGECLPADRVQRLQQRGRSVP